MGTQYSAGSRQHAVANSGTQHSIVGVFNTSVEAERALDQLRAQGVAPEDVSLMMRDVKASEEAASTPPAANVMGGAATGAAFGGLLGGLAGWMLAIGAITLPGVGPIVVVGAGGLMGAGALASMLTGLALGAATGGLIGALLGLGVPEEEARQYESHLRDGQILLTVDPIRRSM